jgi:flagellar hook-associated protein 1 FlgK
MSDLLGIGASGVRSYQTALSAIGQNVSNADTAGYTRRTVSLTENSSGGTGLGSSSSIEFNGVQSASVGRAWNDYQAQAARSAAGDAGSADSIYTWLSNAETSLNDTANGVGQSATAFFSAGTALAGDPNSAANQQSFLSSLGQTATAFNTTATSLASVSSGIATDATTTVQSVNSTLDQIDKINLQLKSTQPGSSQSADLMDQRDGLLDSLSSNVGINVSLDSNGAATVTLAGTSQQLTASPGNTGTRFAITSGANGALALQAIQNGQSTSVTSPGGKLGGLLQSATSVAGRRTQLDKMASDFTAAVNAWQAQGQTSSGAAGGALLSGTTAATIKITTSDPGAIAGASSSAANGNLLSLSSLRGATGIEQSWSSMVTEQGQAVASAKAADTAAGSVASSTMDARNATSGVDLNTEAAELIRYQQAYSGAAKVIQTAQTTMQAILDLF